MNGNNSKKQPSEMKKGTVMTEETFNKLFRSGEAEKKPFPIMLVAAVALALVLVILLTVFLTSYFSVVHLRSEDGGITLKDPMRGVTYYLAPMCYEPIAYFPDDTYAKYKTTEFFKVKNAVATDFICTAENYIYDLYYASDITLPSLAEFKANYTRVCKVENKAIQMGSIEKEATEKIVDHFLTAETVDPSLVIDVDNTLHLKLKSDKYNAIYYVITYYRTGDGSHFLYDRTTGRCVSITDDMAKHISNG